jgi:MerR family copper efflux transcriptional regulator
VYAPVEIYAALDLQVHMNVYPAEVTTGPRIADVARRSGFSAATLRYYEAIGLLPATPRTEGGYRAYDDRTFERLAFITRAKQLGCNLEEIADLTRAWDGGECGPVQDRLQSLVTAKLADARGRIVELMTLTVELQQAAGALRRHRPDGPCDDRCGCTTAPESTVASVRLDAKPKADTEPPVACTLQPDSLAGRIEDWHRLLGFVAGRSRTDGGVRLELASHAPVDDVARLAIAEQECCAFFSFSLTVDGRGVGLEVRAPDDALPIVHALFGSPA